MSSDVASSCSFEMKPADEKKAEMAESMDEKPAAESAASSIDHDAMMRDLAADGGDPLGGATMGQRVGVALFATVIVAVCLAICYAPWIIVSFIAAGKYDEDVYIANAPDQDPPVGPQDDCAKLPTFLYGFGAYFIFMLVWAVCIVFLSVLKPETMKSFKPVIMGLSCCFSLFLVIWCIMGLVWLKGSNENPLCKGTFTMMSRTVSACAITCLICSCNGLFSQLNQKNQDDY